MHFLKYFMLLSYLFITLPVHALTAGYNRFNLTETEIAETAKLRDFLSKHTYSLDRELFTFHYQRGSADGNGEPTDLLSLTNASQSWGAGFFNTDFASDMLGPGHYVSTDLFGSRAFGGDSNPTVIVTVLKPEARILDARQVLGSELSSVKSVYKSLNCAMPKGEQLGAENDSSPAGNSLDTWVRLFRLSTTESCRRVIIQALAELDVTAILYSYSASQTLNDCRDDRQEAFNIISSSAFQPNQVAYFSNFKSLDPNSVGGHLKRLYDEGLKDNNNGIDIPESMEPPPLSIVNLKVSEVEYEKWKAKSIYKCGKQWKNERSGAYSALPKLKDKEVFSLRQLARKAFKKKLGINSYQELDFQMMRGFLKMSAELAGVPFEHWVSGLESYLNYSNPDIKARLRETAKALGENFDGNRFPDQANPSAIENLFELVSLVKTRPHLAFEGLEKYMGMGPKTTLLFLNNFITQLRGVPFVTGELPLASGKNYSQWLSKNRQAYVIYLKACLDQYSNPQVTLEQINEGNCGVVKAKLF